MIAYQDLFTQFIFLEHESDCWLCKASSLVVAIGRLQRYNLVTLHYIVIKHLYTPCEQLPAASLVLMRQ